MQHCKLRSNRAGRFLATMIAGIAIVLGACDAQRPLDDGDESTDAGVDASATKCTVTIQATDPSANENGDAAIVKFERSNCSLDAQLEVKFDLSGTASSSDYVGLADWYVLIPAGQTEATIVVVPFNDTIDENDETLIFTIRAEPHLIVGAPAAATVTISDNDQPIDFTVDVTPPNITLGQCVDVTLNLPSGSWSCTATSTSTGSGWTPGEPATSSNVRHVCPTSVGTHTYGWTCNGVTRTDTTVVSGLACPAPTLSFSITPVTGGGGYTINWDSSNASGCTASGAWNGARSLDGSVIVNPLASGVHTYSMTCTSPCGAVPVTQQGTITVTSTPQPTLCHNEINYYKQSDLANIQECWGYTRVGGVRHSLPKGVMVSGIDSVCAITCERFDDTTVLPLAVSFTWLPGGQEDVPRQYTTGCGRLPDHGPTESDDYLRGGTWDGRCALAVQTLSGPPNTNQ